jgi:hypothetical protein
MGMTQALYQGHSLHSTKEEASSKISPIRNVTSFDNLSNKSVAIISQQFDVHQLIA